MHVYSISMSRFTNGIIEPSIYNMFMHALCDLRCPYLHRIGNSGMAALGAGDTRRSAQAQVRTLGLVDEVAHADVDPILLETPHGDGFAGLDVHLVNGGTILLVQHVHAPLPVHQQHFGRRRYVASTDHSAPLCLLPAPISCQGCGI